MKELKPVAWISEHELTEFLGNGAFAYVDPNEDATATIPLGILTPELAGLVKAAIGWRTQVGFRGNCRITVNEGQKLKAELNLDAAIKAWEASEK